MIERLTDLPTFGLALTLLAFLAGKWVETKVKVSFLNAMMFASALIIALLATTGIEYDRYMKGAYLVSYFIGPATVCLALSIYRKTDILKRYAVPLLAGLTAGIIAGVVVVGLLCRAFDLPHELTAPFYSKSLTTAIAMEVTRIMGGEPSIAIVYVMLTGMSGCLTGFFILKRFGITDPVAQGAALGSAAHAMGVAKGLELGETQGAIAGLAMGVAGILGVVLVPVCARIVGG